MLQARGSATIWTLTANKAMHPQKKLRPAGFPRGNPCSFVRTIISQMTQRRHTGILSHYYKVCPYLYFPLSSLDIELVPLSTAYIYLFP
jgi:hypothetical protein